MSKLNQDQGLMDSILAKEWHTLYAEEIILVMNYAKEQQAKIEKLENELSTTKQVLGNVIDMEVAKVDNLKAQLSNMETCYIEKKKERDELQKTNISLEAGLRKNSKNKQKLLGKNIELQKRIDEALQEVKGLERFTGEDCIADFGVLQGAVSHACKRLEKTLRGDNA